MIRIIFLALALVAFMANAENNSVPIGAIAAPPLVYWSSLGKTEKVKQLLAEKLDPNAVDEKGWSALQAAAENGHIDVVKLLVKAGANLNYSSTGGTALQSATSAKQYAVVQYLKSVGAQ